MPLEWVSFYQYRNLTSRELDTSARQVFFVGENGQGKTNLLEAIYVLHLGSSFRTRIDQQLSQSGKNEWSVLGEIKLDMNCKKVLTKYQAGKKSISIDEKIITDRRELISLETVILFSHDDFLLITAGHESRRQFFDQTLIQISDSYLDSWKRYHHLLKQRNALLKQGRDESLLEVIEQQMEPRARVLTEQRRSWMQSFEAYFVDSFNTVTDRESDLKLVYRPNVDDDDFLGVWRRQRPSDLTKGHTQSGPHRDRWYLRWHNQDFTITASTGQVRLASLSLKVAQALFLKERANRPMVFLLDDVLLELDRDKRRRLMDHLPGYNQVFYTFLPGDHHFFTDDSRLVYTIKEGSWQKTIA